MSKPVAVVVGVGAEKELGAALWRRFAAGGYHVLVASRTADKTADKIEKIATTIVSSDGSAAPVIRANIGLPKVVVRMRHSLLLTHGKAA